MIGAILTLGLGAFSTVNYLPTLGYGDFSSPPAAADSVFYNIAMFPIGMGLNG